MIPSTYINSNEIGHNSGKKILVSEQRLLWPQTAIISERVGLKGVYVCDKSVNDASH